MSYCKASGGIPQVWAGLRRCWVQHRAVDCREHSGTKENVPPQGASSNHYKAIQALLCVYWVLTVSVV